jgi:hypothetical protein
MVYRWSVNGPSTDDYDICYVRSRRLWPWRSSMVYEAVGTRDGQLEVLAATRRVPSESDAAAASLLKLTAILQRDGWAPTQEPRMMGQDIVACYTRPVRQNAL